MRMPDAITRSLIRAAPLAMLGLGLGAVACSDDTSSLSGPDAELTDIDLNVRVHLLESDEFESLDATLSDADVETLFQGVNRVWSQAAITWTVESVVREPSGDGTAYELALRGAIPFSFEILASILPRDNLLPGAWDVFVIRDFGNIAGGVYIDALGSVVVAELGPAGDQGPLAAGPRILAHELGHSLSLAHVPCTPAGNLMAPGCPGADRTRLEAPQIDAARRQAGRGRAFGS